MPNPALDAYGMAQAGEGTKIAHRVSVVGLAGRCFAWPHERERALVAFRHERAMRREGARRRTQGEVPHVRVLEIAGCVAPIRAEVREPLPLE